MVQTRQKQEDPVFCALPRDDHLLKLPASGFLRLPETSSPVAEIRISSVPPAPHDRRVGEYDSHSDGGNEIRDIRQAESLVDKGFKMRIEIQYSQDLLRGSRNKP